MAKPWKTSDDIIDAVKRKIMFPISQSTFDEDDILAFANEEMASSQVPSILQFHEEYFVTSKTVALVANKSRYPIPDRAIGLRLRDLFFIDSAGNLFEMTRILPGEEDAYQNGSDSGTPPYQYKIEGNDVVVVPEIGGSPTGSLIFSYYIRPNQLVRDSRAAIIEFFTESITLVNASIVAGDTVTIGDVEFEAVASGATSLQFNIGATSVETATNLATAINTDGTYSASNGNPSTAIVTIDYEELDTEISVSNSTGFVVAETTGIRFEEIPEHIKNGSQIDFLQTKPGHKIMGIDVTIPDNAISGTIIEFNSDDVPSDLEIGDYICLAHEAIIPQIPPDLHNILAERTASRILAALGDQAGLQASTTKIQEMEANQGRLIDNRTEGSPQKITGRHSLLRLMSRRRRGW